METFFFTPAELLYFLGLFVKSWGKKKKWRDRVGRHIFVSAYLFRLFLKSWGKKKNLPVGCPPGR